MSKRPLKKPDKLNLPCKRLKDSVPLSSVADAVEPPANCNEIFNLNNDCLLLVFSHLSKHDLFALIMADGRFRDLVIDSRMFRGQLEIDEKFLERYPLTTSQCVYKGIGLLGNDVSISLPNFEFTLKQIMPLLQDLDTLVLTEPRYPPYWHIPLQNFPLVRCLRGDFVLSIGQWERLFRHLNPTLQELDCPRVKLCYLQGLNNLTILTMNANTVKKGYGVLFQRNPKLEGLRVRFVKNNFVRDWTNISNRRAIKKLHLDYVTIPRERIVPPVFLYLRSFRMTFVKGDCELLHDFLDKLSTKLEVLIIDYDLKDSWNSLEFDSKLARFTKLRKLTFTKDIPMEIFSMDGILQLVSLKKLTLHVASAEWTLSAIDKLPNLVKMNNDLIEINSNWSFAKDLRTKLHEKKRELQYNDKWIK